ncbi:MAG: hypothetical protein ACREXP_22440 [Steroidobacteraceae bacterium]
MATQHVLAIFAAIFLLFALARILRNAGRIDPAAKTWLIITVIFAAVSTWLFLST